MYKSIRRVLLALMTMVLVTACGSAATEPKITFQLKTHNNQEVTVPGDKPVLLFFFTTYT